MTGSIKSLVWATDIDVLERDRVLERRDGYWAVHSPTNPTFWWGNFLLFDEPPGAGDGERWESLFAAEYSARSEVTHRTFAWDRTDGEAGDAEREFVERGYELEWTAGLVAGARADRQARARQHGRHGAGARPAARRRSRALGAGARRQMCAGTRGCRRRLPPDVSAPPPSRAAQPVRGGPRRLVRGPAGRGGRQLPRHRRDRRTSALPGRSHGRMRTGVAGLRPGWSLMRPPMPPPTMRSTTS